MENYIAIFILAFASLPIYIIQKKYKNMDFEEEPIKTSKLRTFFKIIGAILFIPFCLIGIPIISEVFISSLLFGKEFTYLMTSDLYVLYTIAVLCMFFLLLYLYSNRGVLYSFKGNQKLRSKLPRTLKRKITLYGIGILFIVFLIYSFWFDLFTEDGAVKQRLFIHEEYSWDDVDYYTLSNGTDGLLEYTVVMKDGSRLDCLGGSISISNFSEEKYPDGEEDYCRYLTETFAKRGIELRVDDWEKLYKKLDYDYWADFAKELREIAY